MEKIEKKQKEKVVHSVAEKCRAVLLVWTEKRKPAEICRELGLKWVTFQHWQDRAMEGMLQALEPRVNLDLDPVLNPRLLTLIENRCKPRVRETTASNRLMKRLSQIQDMKNAEKKEEQSAK